MYWLLNNANYFYLFFGVIALGLLYAWWLNRKRQLLAAGGVIAGLLLLLWMLNLFITTDRQQISAIIYDMTSAVGEKRFDDIVNHLSEDFSHQAQSRLVTKKEVRDSLESVIKAFGVEHVGASQIRIDTVSRSERIAEVRFNISVSLSNGRTIPFLCRSEFTLEDGKWRMKRITFHPGFSDSERTIHVPIP